jgi:hypothetical protein
MPARTNPQQVEKTIERIKVTLIVKRLMEHILSEDGILNSSQVRAAEILMKKVIPDLAHSTAEVTHTMSDELTTRLTVARERAHAERLVS